jgi:hypothetical protein
MRGYNALRFIGSLCAGLSVIRVPHTITTSGVVENTDENFQMPRFNVGNNLQATKNLSSNSFHFRPLFLYFFNGGTRKVTFYRKEPVPMKTCTGQKTQAVGNARGLLQYYQLPNKNTRDISSDIWNFSRYYKALCVYSANDVLRNRAWETAAYSKTSPD